MAAKLLVLQHSPWEGPGQYLLDAAEGRGIRLGVARVWEEPIPDPTLFDGLIVLGGSPNVEQEQQFPFLRAEKEVIGRALAADMPYLGFCLGHQLLAHVLGARVGTNFRPSIGFIQGHLTHAGREHPVLRALPRLFAMFKWHGQAVLEPLPGHLEVLATSADCQVEAIGVRERPHIVGVQFDNHAAAPENVAAWLSKDAKWLASLPGLDIDPGLMVARARQQSDALALEFGKLFDAFLVLIRK